MAATETRHDEQARVVDADVPASPRLAAAVQSALASSAPSGGSGEQLPVRAHPPPSAGKENAEHGGGANDAKPPRLRRHLAQQRRWDAAQRAKYAMTAPPSAGDTPTNNENTNLHPDYTQQLSLQLQLELSAATRATSGAWSGFRPALWPQRQTQQAATKPSHVGSFGQRVMGLHKSPHKASRAVPTKQLTPPQQQKQRALPVRRASAAPNPNTASARRPIKRMMAPPPMPQMFRIGKAPAHDLYAHS